MGTSPEVLLEHALEQRLAAALALGPQSFGHLGLGHLGGLDAGTFALEPGHGDRSSGTSRPRLRARGRYYIPRNRLESPEQPARGSVRVPEAGTPGRRRRLRPC